MVKAIGVLVCLLFGVLIPGTGQTVWEKTAETFVTVDPPFKQCHASTIVALDSGKIMTAWFGGSHEGSNDVVIWSSVLNKSSWSKPMVIADGVIDNTSRYPTWNPVLFKEKNGTLYLFYKVGPNPRRWWGMVKSSTNDGKSWSSPKRLADGILGPIKNKPIQLADGSILAPSSTESDRSWNAHIERSIDGGKSWSFIPVDTASAFDVIQPSILQFADNRLQVVCRSKQGYVMQASSNDGGKTWGKLSPTSLINPNSGTDAITLRNGLQLIVYNPDAPGRDWWNGRSKLHVAISRDGTSWSDVAVLENGTQEEFSYPAVIQTSDGKVHITYTYDRKNIKYVVLEEKKVHSLIPFPSILTSGDGEFTLTPRTQISSGTGFEIALSVLQQRMQQAFGKSLKTVPQGGGAIQLKHDESIKSYEGYRIEISLQRLIISARTPAGMFRALQTVRQLLPMETKGVNVRRLKLPVLTINDEPAFSWRGLHLDVARHFFSIQYIEKLLDRMAFYKFNKLHLHLTDDQGWRIEIKKYPLLTEKGAWRTFDKNDSACMRLAKSNPDMAIDPQHIIRRDGKTLYGGFYTQDEMKKLVKYAADRYIDIIPEIDMPGHMMSAIHVYPELSCVGGSTWGELFSTPICPCKESTYTFAQDVFSEIMEIFPSEYIHLGADEVDRKSWKESPLCQELMRKEGLANDAELQSYFVKRMEKFFQSKKRKLIGWDEILEGGVSATARVMYWRSWVPEAPVHAARNGNDVIMSPGNPLYFDYPPDNRSLSNIYHFNVIPPDLSAKDARSIIGAQANLWSEYVPSENRADHLYFPRAVALAEKVWSQHLNFSSFSQRLITHYKWLETLGVHYRLPDLEGLTQENVFTDNTTLDLTPPLPDLALHYTTDGSLPTVKSPEIKKPIVITTPVIVKVAAFNASGLRGDVYTLNYKKETFMEPQQVDGLQSGLLVKYYKKFFNSAMLLNHATPDSQYVAKDIGRADFKTAPSFGLQFNGYIDVPETGIYSFYFLCDDGGVLTIGDREVVNNDGLHAPVEKSGQVALKKGLHPIRLNFIEGGGGYSIELKYSRDKGVPMVIPKAWLKFRDQ